MIQSNWFTYFIFDKLHHFFKVLTLVFYRIGLDVHSFGLFLLELLTGEDSKEAKALTSNDELIQWINVEIKPRFSSNTFVDKRMNGTFTREALNSVMIIMVKCLKFPAITRPKMVEIVTELEQVYQKDLTGEEDCSTKFTLGSELFSMIAWKRELFLFIYHRSLLFSKKP